MKVRTLSAAEDDLHSAAKYLESKRAGWGIQLFDEYEAALEDLEIFPRMCSLVDDPISGHECPNALLKRLRYRIVYEVRSNEVLVVAVLHTSRRDGIWHYRLHHLN